MLFSTFVEKIRIKNYKNGCYKTLSRMEAKSTIY